MDSSIRIKLLVIAYYIWHFYNRLLFICHLIYCHVLRQFKVNSDIPKGLRIPKHIAMTFTNETKNLDLYSIAKLICWSKQLGVANITLYDDLGYLKLREEELFECLVSDEKPIGYIKGLSILSKEDGRKKFVEDVRDLLHKVEPQQVNLEKVQDYVGWTSDPELLINFGSPLCLRGFPPWQLRLTEIFSIPTHRNIPQKVFIDCLKNYSRTNQRIGA